MVDNKKRIRKVIIYGFVLTTSLVVTLIIGIIIGRVWQHSFDQEYALSNLAERLKVENSPQVIRDTVHCQLLDMGASKSVISKNLNLIGSYQEYESWNGSISIVFDDYFTQLTVHELVLRFEDDKLVDKRYEVTPDSTIPIVCP